FNAAIGGYALFRNMNGNYNTANGHAALYSNMDGNYNTAVGFAALYSNMSGSENTAIGRDALYNNTTGGHNTAVGDRALHDQNGGHGNVALGSNAGSNVTTASKLICIGADVAGSKQKGSCFIGHIYPNVQHVVGHDPDNVTINSNGRLGRGNVSSRRYKHDIQPMAKGSEVLLGLKPVSFRYNKEYDATQTLAFGL